MLTMKVEHLVAQIVKQELRGKGRKNEALYLNFDLGMSYFSKGNEYSQRQGLHLLYHSLPHGSVITVFSALTESPFARRQDVQEWKHECSHDTCWRDVNTFSNAYFGMAECINAMLRKDGKFDVAPKDMHEFNHFDLSDRLFEWVPVEVTYDETDDFRHRRVVKFL